MSLSLHDRERLKSFLVELYGAPANGWVMNEAIFNVTYKLIDASKACSDLMDFVPRPINPFSNPLKQLGRQVVKAFLRELSGNKEHYAICLNQAKANWRTEFERARNGI